MKNKTVYNNTGNPIVKFIFIIGLSFITFFNLNAIDNGVALTPPMGWNSWNTFSCSISESLIMSIADSMVSKGLKDAGYSYIVIDDCWQMGRDSHGKIIADSVHFPSGMKYLADYVHSKGLKFGLYTCAGTATCQGRPGSYDYEAIDAQTYADWGVDYLKEDWCNTTGLNAPIQYKKMSDDLVATGRPIVFSICEWGGSSPWEWAENVGNLWRTTSDIQNCWSCRVSWGGMGWTLILEKQVNLAPFAGPGHWNDPDMLEVGNGMTTTECRSHFSMWCMLAAPLIAGNDIRNMSKATKNILTAPEIIAVDQDSLGIQAVQIIKNSGLEVWRKQLKDSSVAVALLNLTTKASPIMVTWKEIGIEPGAAKVRDLWAQADLASTPTLFRLQLHRTA